MNVRGRNVYLSGPMTSLEHFGVGRMAEAHAIVKEAGAASVYDPGIEYLTHGSQMDSHEVCMRRTLHELTKVRRDGLIVSRQPFYDVVVTLPGWEESPGAKTEVEVARACGIRVIGLADVGRPERPWTDRE